MPYWWQDRGDERFWVEIRRLPGIGTSLYAPTLDESGGKNAWYELVASVAAGEVVYHYNARESRFVGRSIAAENAVEDRYENAYTVELRDFQPILAPVDLAFLRARADEIYHLRDRLLEEHGSPLYLPFQFKADRALLGMMSNYFARSRVSWSTCSSGPMDLRGIAWLICRMSPMECRMMTTRMSRRAIPRADS